MDVSLELVRRIRPAVERHARRTPLVESAWLSDATGRRVLLKCENLQVTGSFKVRGALAALALLEPDELARGVHASSTGNHGQALAFAARRLGVPCTVVVPRGAPANKLEKIRAHGARVVEHASASYDEVESWTRGHPGELGGTFVSPYEDAAVIAGNGGTTALEILEEEPAVRRIVVPTGGGGLVCGVGLAARALAPGARVVAVNPERSAAMWLSRRDGRAWTRLDASNGGGATIADGVEGGVGAANFALARDLVDDVVLVPEDAIEAAMREVLVREHLVVEGAGALGVAALLEEWADGGTDGSDERRAAGRGTEGRGAEERGTEERGGCDVVVLTGGNVDPRRLASLLRN